MSSRIHPYTGAMVERSDSLTCEPIAVETRRGPMMVDEVRVKLYRGLASDGYSTGYQRRPVAWVEMEAFAGGKLAKRACTRFAGKRLDKVDAEYQKALAQVLEGVRPITATFPIPAAA